MKTKEKQGITLIALVITIIVLLILAGISILMLAGDNGVLVKATEAKDKTLIGDLEEKVQLAIDTLLIEYEGDANQITPNGIAGELNKTEHRTDIKANKNTFPTDIIFTAEKKGVKVNLNLKVAGTSEVEIDDRIYSEAGIDETMVAPTELFDIVPIENSGTASIGTINSLPVKEAKITRIKPQYCNYDGYNPDTTKNDFGDTNYEIIYEGNKISDTLVIPYQVEIDGEMYKITEVNLTALSPHCLRGGSLPKVETIIYPNTVTKIHGGNYPAEGWPLKMVVLSNQLTEIPEYMFKKCSNLTSINIPKSVTKIGSCAFQECTGLTGVYIPENVVSIDYGAFSECSAGIKIKCEATEKPEGWNMYWCDKPDDVEWGVKP